MWGTFKYPDIYWRSCTAICKQSRFLESIDKMPQVVEDPTRNGVLIDLIVTNKEVLLGMWKLGPALAVVTPRL